MTLARPSPSARCTTSSAWSARTAREPSAENIAEWFARELGAAVAGEDAVVQAVTIWEGPVNSVTFRP